MTAAILFPSYVLFTTTRLILFFFFFFNDTATTEIYTLSLHDALPISFLLFQHRVPDSQGASVGPMEKHVDPLARCRSEEHTSELQSRLHLVCRLLLEKKKTTPFLLVRYM